MKAQNLIIKFLILLTAAIVGLNSFTIISTGSEASVESFGKVHDGEILTGFNLVAPWWGIDEYDGLLETEIMDDTGIPSMDKFKTSMDISYTGHFLSGYADKVRGSTGKASKFIDTHVFKKVRSCAIRAGTRVKSSQAFFDETIQTEMSTFVVDCVNSYINSDEVGGGYEITQIQFTDINLDPVVKKFMVTTKQRQEQEEQQESALAIADLKAQEVTKISAANLLASADNKQAAANVSDAKLYDMQQTALGNIELSKSVTTDLVRYMEAKRWDGVRSKIIAGEGTGLLVDTRNK